MEKSSLFCLFFFSPDAVYHAFFKNIYIFLFELMEGYKYSGNLCFSWNGKTPSPQLDG